VIDLFLADMIYLVNKVVEAGTLFSTTGLTKANALSATMKAVGEALEAGIGGLIKPQGPAATAVTLSDYAGIAHDIFDLFLADMVYIVSVVQAAALEFTEKGVVQAGQFAAAGAEIFGAIEDGVGAAAAVANLPGSTGLTTALVFIVNSVTDAVTEVTRGFNALLVAGYHFGYDWVSNIIAGITDRMDDLEALMAYIRGLFPSSPAKYGAWRTLPEGKAVGKEFATDLASGVWGGAGGVVGALGALREAFGISPQGLATAPAAISSGGSITININNPTVRSNRDIEMMASQISDILAMRAATSSRLGHTW
jgi:hypothetical protein